MKLSLFDNAIDFLETSIEHLFWLKNNDPYYEKDSSTRHVKQLILSLTSASELLIKVVLSETNDLLIYDEISKELLEYFKFSKEYTLHEYLVRKEINIKTIDFQECIKRLFDSSDISIEYSKYFDKLRLLRNKFIHFGISTSEEYYELIYCVSNIYSVFEFQEPFRSLISNYYKEKNRDYNPLLINRLGEDIVNDRLSVMMASIVSTNIVNYEWIKINSSKLRLIIEELSVLFVDTDIRQGDRDLSGSKVYDVILTWWW